MYKKFAALLLAVALCAACGVTAWAEMQQEPFEEQELCLFNPGEETAIGWLTLGEYTADQLEVSAEWGEKCAPYIRSVRLGAEAAGDIQILICLRDYWGLEPVEITGYLQILEKETGRNVTPEVRPIIPSQRIRLRDGFLGWNRDQGLYSLGKEYRYDAVTQTLVYPEFRGEAVSKSGQKVDAPVLDLTQFPGEISRLEISFGKSGVSFAGRMIRQEPLNLLYSQAPDSFVRDLDPGAEMEFISFPAEPEWDFTGTVSWKLPDSERQWHVYAVEGQALTELETAFSDAGDCICFQARKFGSYVLCDSELESRPAAVETPAPQRNPETGRAGMALVSALGVIELL
ncbi:MAG: hypothetical protein SOX72_06785 [Oscillospiraceae bacterium]|nr:hypothetical protein [Oscillospiraceae bacterium]MDY4191905.1 hypothetical protein [Oscillospiraceae bacterium]